MMGASAVVADSDGRILLQRRSDSGGWAPPGGVMDIGETLAECAIREVRKETGFDVRIESRRHRRRFTRSRSRAWRSQSGLNGTVRAA